MVITQQLFAAYLNCPTKAYLMSSEIPKEQTKCGRWKADIQNRLRQHGVELLRKQSRLEIKESPMADDFSAKGSALYVNCSVGVEELRSVIDAIEKVQLRGKKTQLLPCRCQLDKREKRHEALLLGYDALCLQAFTGVSILLGKLVDGVTKRTKKVQLNSLLKVVQEHIGGLTELLGQEKEPPLILNRHCVECKFRVRCREKATETDDLSLLSKMSFKERKKLHNKGIFTVTQLSYTFRPRRAIPDFEYINRASYWDYQRDRIVLRSRRLRKRIRMQRSRRPIKYRANKAIAHRRTIACPYCKSGEIYKWGPREKTVYDLKFSPAGIKRWVVSYQFDRHKCWQCSKTFMPPRKPWTRSKYGEGLLRYLVFLTVDLQISQRAAKKLINQFFGLDLSGESAGRFKKTAAAFYKVTYTKILQNIVKSPLAHVDETKVSLNGRSAYVWVLANHEDVAYFVSESREGQRFKIS
jgi:CRISPR/Cas system-associated exonuclease Cas4 (RecB family)